MDSYVNLFARNEKVQLLYEQYMTSKKLYYGYILNFIGEYWRNIYLKCKEKIRIRSMLVININNMIYRKLLLNQKRNFLEKSLNQKGNFVANGSVAPIGSFASLALLP